MKLSTIWSLHGLSTMERLRRTRDWSALEVGRHLPVRVKYWVAMNMIALATKDSPDIMGMKVDELLKNLPAPKNMT